MCYHTLGDQSYPLFREVGMVRHAPSLFSVSVEESHVLPQLVADWLEWADTYRHYSPFTLLAYRRDAARFLSYLRAAGVPLRLEAITHEVITRYAESLAGRKRASIIRQVAAVGSFFTWARDHKLTDAEPCRRIPLPARERTLPRLPAPGDVAAVLRACSHPWQHCALLLLITTGLRRAELVSLLLTDVDLEAGLIRVHGKGLWPSPWVPSS